MSDEEGAIGPPIAASTPEPASSPVATSTPEPSTSVPSAATSGTTSPPKRQPTSPNAPKLDCPECPEEEGVEEFDKSASGKPDASNTEFVYYSSTLREISSKLTNEVDRHLIIPWIRKLFRPEYHSVRFRIKRNKYLLHLVLLLMNDEAWGIFRLPPPEGALLHPEELIAQSEAPIFAEWEKDPMWEEVLMELPTGLNRMECTIHQSPEGCKEDKEHGKQLDEEFTFLLYLTRPYCILLRSASERTRAAIWLQTLCTIRPDACSGMKRLRNEYIIAMLGYVHELRVAGPFSGAPWNPLPPLADIVRMLADKHPVLDPCSHEADEFLSSQPMPDEGAFCYMAITGKLLDSSMEELD